MPELLILQLTKDELKHLIRETLNESITVKERRDSDDLVKIEDVCKTLKVSKVTIHKWKREGVIPFHRISNRIFFKLNEVIESLRKVEAGKGKGGQR